MAFDWFFIVAYQVYKKGISSCIQGQFSFGRTHLSECTSAAWQCVGWTISKMKYKVQFSLTSSPLFKGERRKVWLNYRKIEKRVWKITYRHFRSIWGGISAVSWNHWGVKGEKDGWMDGWCGGAAPLTPVNPRTSQHCILACTARIVSWHDWPFSYLAVSEPANIVFSLMLQELLAGVTGHFSCLWIRAENQTDLTLSLSLYRSSELGRSGAPWLHLELLMPGVTPVW